MNTIATDSVRGLRVLRGIGGESAFADRCRKRSAETRDAGIGVAWPVAGIEALKRLVSGVLVVGLTWIGAALVVEGRLTVGELVAFYGYAGFMVLPVTLFADVISTTVASLVGARRIVGLLDVSPLVSRGEGEPGTAEPMAADVASGLTIRNGEHVGAVPATEALPVADRLARLVPDNAATRVLLGGVDATEVAVDEVRRRVVVADAVPFLFSGTLRTVLDPHGVHDDAAIVRAIEAADAMDVLDAAEHGLNAEVPERGIHFSGGQRQRLGIARALLSDAEMLALMDPTASVDAATESRMADGIAAHRKGRSTMFATTSALVLAHTRRVQVLDDCVVVSTGAHRDLVAEDDAYRKVVLRGEGFR